MNSVKCPSCGLTNWATAAECKRCGRAMNAGRREDMREQYLETGTDRPGYEPFSGVDQGDLSTGLAITSMVLGIAGLLSSFILIGILMLPFALIFGVIAFVKATKRPSQYGGKGFAITGIVTSCVGVLFVLPLIAAIAIPNFLAARRAAYEASAISSVRRIVAAQSEYLNIRNLSTCPDLKSLGSEHLIDGQLATGTKSGYTFESGGSMASGCEVRATSVFKWSGGRSFYYSNEDEVLRVGAKLGVPAARSDPALTEVSSSFGRNR